MTVQDAPAPQLRRTARWLWVAATVFTLYAATLPFDFVTSGAVVREHVRLAAERSALSRLPALSRADALQNVLLFVPFGLFAVASLGRTRPFPALFTAIVSGTLLSAGCEALQLLTADRISSLWDVWANLAGCLLGGTVGLAGLRIAPRVDARYRLNAMVTADTFPVLSAAALVCIATWEPFDVTLDVGTIWSKLKPFVTGTWMLWQAPTDELLTALRFGMLSFLSAHALEQRGIPSTRARWSAAAACAAAAAMLEGSQFLVTSRSPAVQDLCAAVAGAIAGALMTTRAVVRGKGARGKGLVLLVALTTMAAVPFYLQPFALAPRYRGAAALPFLAYYEFTTLQTLSHVIDLLLIYAPIGFAFQWSRRDAAVLRVVVVCGVVASLLEYSQGWVVGRFPDVTDVGMAVLGGLAGAWVARYGEQAVLRVARGG